MAVLFTGCANYEILEKLEMPDGRQAAAKSICGSACRIFVTQASYAGTFGGPAAADTICRHDSGNPAGAGNGNWKAMLSGTNRTACTSNNCSAGGSAENTDWVMRPHTPYFRPDGTLIATTNAFGIFVYPLGNAIEAGNNNVWTGFYATWTRSDGNDHCGDWTSDAATGIYALSGSADVTGLANFHIGCTNGHRLYCVEQ